MKTSLGDAFEFHKYILTSQPRVQDNLSQIKVILSKLAIKIFHLFIFFYLLFLLLICPKCIAAMSVYLNLSCLHDLQVSTLSQARKESKDVRLEKDQKFSVYHAQ